MTFSAPPILAHTSPLEFLLETSRHTAKSFPGRTPSQPPSLLQLKHISLNSEIPLKRLPRKRVFWSLACTPKPQLRASLTERARAQLKLEDLGDLNCSWHQFSIRLKKEKKKNHTTIWCFGFPIPRNGEGIIYPLELSRMPWQIWKLCGNKQASAIWWSKIQITLKLVFLIYSHQPHYIIDLRCLVILWRRNGRGEGEQRPYQQ